MTHARYDTDGSIESHEGLAHLVGGNDSRTGSGTTTTRVGLGRGPSTQRSFHTAWTSPDETDAPYPNDSNHPDEAHRAWSSRVPAAASPVGSDLSRIAPSPSFTPFPSLPRISTSSSRHVSPPPSPPATWPSPFLPDPPAFPRPVLSASPEPYTSTLRSHWSSQAGNRVVETDSLRRPGSIGPSTRPYVKHFSLNDPPLDRQFDDDDDDGGEHLSAWLPSLAWQRRGTHDDDETIDEDDRIESERGEFAGLAGRYQHGVGYERGASGVTDPIDAEKRAKRMRRLERAFGRVGQAELEAGRADDPEGTASLSTRMTRYKEHEKRERTERERRSGVDRKGRLVVDGRKKRTTMRWVQGVGSIVVGFGSIGAPVLTHPEPKPPQSGSLPLIILYVLPFLSLFATTYFHLVRPAVHLRRTGRTDDRLGPPNSPFAGFASGFEQTGTRSGASPYGHGGGGGGGCCGTSRARVPRGLVDARQHAYQPTSINVFVDPSMFPLARRSAEGIGSDSEFMERSKRRRKREKKRRRKEREQRRHGRQVDGARTSGNNTDDDDDDLATSSPASSTDSLSSSSSSPSPSRSGRTASTSPHNPRSFSSILSHVALETACLEARKRTKQVALVDFLTGAVWVGVSVWTIGWSETCKPATFDGFCHEARETDDEVVLFVYPPTTEPSQSSDLYNLSIAFACLVGISCFVSFSFDCLDLSRTKVSPRHRQQARIGRRGT
ncbi:hypothetical protein JCM10212_001059 [Sporobolomyces blumeae]